MRLATQEVRCQIVAIEQVMDSSTLAITPGEIDSRSGATKSAA